MCSDAACSGWWSCDAPAVVGVAVLAVSVVGGAMEESSLSAACARLVAPGWVLLVLCVMVSRMRRVLGRLGPAAVMAWFIPVGMRWV